MLYSLITIWRERNRFLPGILAVSFSAVLIAVQCSLLLGMFSIVSIPIDRSSADIWVGHPGVLSIDLSLPIPEEWQTRLAAQPEVARTEIYLQGYVLWSRSQDGAVETCAVIGTRLDDDAVGAIRDLSPELRFRLTEPGAIVVDEAERERLGITREGYVAEVMGCRVCVVGFVNGLKGLTGAYIFCSIQTARMLLSHAGLRDDQAIYLLARCHDPADAPKVVRRLRDYPNMSAFTAEEFSRRSRLHWLTKTKAGLSLSCAALLGLIDGAAVTSQTLYAATVASLREYAVLEALGIPTWRMIAMVLAQSLWVGLLGILLAVPVIFGMVWLFERLGSKVMLPPWLLAATVAVTLAMALLSGVIALRSLRLVEPTSLLR